MIAEDHWHVLYCVTAVFGVDIYINLCSILRIGLLLVLTIQTDGADMSSTAFIEPLPVIDFVTQLLNRDVSARPLSDADRVKV